MTFERKKSLFIVGIYMKICEKWGSDTYLLNTYRYPLTHIETEGVGKYTNQGSL